MSWRRRTRTAPATLPPPGLPGLDPAWSALVRVPDSGGVSRTFHLLDSWAGGAPAPADRIGTVLCVHGNPTWSYLWRGLLAAAPPGWRVVAVDQLGMGYSERIDRPRVLADRVDDLGRLTGALAITGPVVTVGHDWGGIISLGWALQHADQLQGVVLLNTAVHQPAGSSGPILIRLARVRLVNRIACSWTPLFVRATTSLSWRPRLAREVRDAFAAPYRTATRRRGVAEFVADIPFEPDHPSHPAVAAIAAGVPGLDVPALLLWGPRDPVFSNRHLRDLQERLPRAVLHRYERAGHLLTEDAPEYVDAVRTWIGRLPKATSGAAAPADSVAAPAYSGAAAPAGSAPASAVTPGGTARESVLARLAERAGDPTAAIVEVGGSTISWAELNARVNRIAAGLNAVGLQPGDRVALLVPPSIELTVALYAVWRAGGVIVVADRGLGLRGMGRALRSARLDYLIAETAGLLAARFMRLPGVRIAAGENAAAMQRFGRAELTLEGLAESGSGRGFAADAADDDEAAVLFTSGATGPAKGVLYRHCQVRAQLDMIATTCRLRASDRIVAAFAPLALYGPALGICSAVPRTDVTKPGQLTAAALGEAASAIAATVVFASPAALRNVVATADRLSAGQQTALNTVRLVMSAGASVPAPLLRQVQRVLPNAALHTPYGMTEALPLTDISLTEIEIAGDGDGVCVGRPLPGVSVRIAPLDRAGLPSGELTVSVGVTGEIWATGAHIRDRYDSRWMTDMAAAGHPGWHRTGDIGQLDEEGRLWIQGRLVHLITTAAGPVTPVGIELRVQDRLAGAPAPGIAAAAVGVGPAGIQQVVVVLTGPGGPLAPLSVIDAVRAAAGVPVAAVLIRKSLPVDIRHNSKIDRVAVGEWASRILAGR